MASGYQLHEIEPGDVLHHAAAGLDRLAAPIDHADADQGVAGGAGIDATRAGDVAGSDRADRRLAGCAEKRAMVHRLEGQHLAAITERLLDVGKRGAGARADHHLGGLVERDAGEAGAGERALRLRRAAEARAAVAADDGERRAACDDGFHDGASLRLCGGDVEGHECAAVTPPHALPAETPSPGSAAMSCRTPPSPASAGSNLLG